MAAAKAAAPPVPGPAAARPSRRPTAPAESGGAEQRQAQQPDAARADQVDQAAGHHDHAAIGQDVAVEHPVQLDGRAAQGLADGRQHHGRAGEAERDEQGGQAGGNQLQPAPGSRGNGVRVSRHVAGSQEERRAWRHGPGKNRGWPLKKNRLVFRIFRTLKSVMQKSASCRGKPGAVAMDSLSGISVFVLVAETRSFSEAGRVLGCRRRRWARAWRAWRNG